MTKKNKERERRKKFDWLKSVRSFGSFVVVSSNPDGATEQTEQDVQGRHTAGEGHA
jgi:hypothetical protein